MEFSLVEMVVEGSDGKLYSVGSDYINENLNNWFDEDDIREIIYFGGTVFANG